jgi:hypothetical protein
VSVLRADGSWQIYNTSNSGLARDDVYAIAVDAAGNKWFGTIAGASVWFGGADYAIVDNAQWPSPTTRYRATYDFSSLIPRGAYALTVSDARGMDGIEIAPCSGVSFTVDYAGSINDTTPPPPPSVLADICRNSATSASASWSAYDPNSAITLYRYALGTAPNGIDVLNWTDTSATSVTRTGLNLVTGQRYYFSVRARNAGGLWSEASSGGFTAGVPCSKVYLPIVVKSP